MTHRPRLRKEEGVVFCYWFPGICHHFFWRQENFLTPLPGKSLPGYKWKNHLAVGHFPARVPWSWLIQKGPWQSTFPTRVAWYKPTYDVMDPTGNVGICVCRLHPPNDRHLCLSPTCQKCRPDKSATFCDRESLHFFVEFMICVRSLRQTLLFSKV